MQILRLTTKAAYIDNVDTGGEFPAGSWAITLALIAM
jgi:hypothetical protein